MESRFVKALIIATCAALPVAAAHAGATLMQDNRESEISATVSEGINSQGIGPLTDAPNFGEPYNLAWGTGAVESITGAANASSRATQLSSFDATPVFSQISADGSAIASGGVDSFSIDSDAQAEARSDFDIQFTVFTTQTYLIDASINDPGTGVTAYVRLREVGAGDFIYNLQQSGETGDAMGMLPPGDYELLARASAAGFAQSDGVQIFNRSGSFDFDFTIVPEPAAGLLMLCCAGVVVRRRTRSQRGAAIK